MARIKVVTFSLLAGPGRRRKARYSFTTFIYTSSRLVTSPWTHNVAASYLATPRLLSTLTVTQRRHVDHPTVAAAKTSDWLRIILTTYDWMNTTTFPTSKIHNSGLNDFLDSILGESRIKMHIFDGNSEI